MFGKRCNRAGEEEEEVQTKKDIKTDKKDAIFHSSREKTHTLVSCGNSHFYAFVSRDLPRVRMERGELFGGDFFRFWRTCKCNPRSGKSPSFVRRKAMMNNIMSMTIGRAGRAACSNLLAHRRAILRFPSRLLSPLASTPTSSFRCISASAPSLTGHPEDRLEAARKRARAALGLPENDEDVVAPSGVKLSSQATRYSDNNSKNNSTGSIAALSRSSSQSSLHPEDRLKAARRKALAALGLPQDADAHAMQQQPPKVVSPAVAAAQKKRPKAILSGLNAEQPPLVRNDGSSSGAVACMRLREARRNAMERLLASSSASASAAAASAPTTDRKKS